MEEIVKTHFPTYKVNNASNRTMMEILKITELCHNNDSIIVFIYKNDVNKEYFQMAEKIQRVKNINLIFLNKDNMYFYELDESNDFLIEFTKIVKLVQGKLTNNNTSCAVCKLQCKNKYLTCSECNMHIHKKCFANSNECSKCKNNKFYEYL